MEYRLLGKTGLQVSRLAFGTLTLGPLQNHLSPREGGEVIAEAVQAGVNLADTAQLYETYEHLREAIRLTGDRLMISSKTYAYEAPAARKAVEQARRALDRDVIEIFLLHEQESEHTLRGHAAALEALLTLKAQGVIKAVGLSTHHIAGVRAAKAWQLDVVHPLLNRKGLGIADGSAAEMEAAVREAHEAGVGVFLMKALGGGNLFQEAEQSLAYVRALDCADAVAVGMKNKDEVRANIRFWESGSFSEAEKAKLTAQKRRLHIENWCRGCGACVPACKAKALAVQGEQVCCDQSKCVLCGYCASKCENFCIKVV